MEIELTENMKEWFKELLDGEIEQATGAAENERLWSNGSDNDIESSLHELNSIENEKYVEFLESVKMKYLGEDNE